MGKCLLHAQCSDLCLSSQTRGSKSLGSATDANVNMERNTNDSVVCGVKGYAQGAPVEPPMPAFRGMPSCHFSVVCSLFVHHMFPKGLWRGDPSASLCTGRCTYGLGAQGHPAASSMKASKAATPMVHHVGRAPAHGAGQGIE